MWKKIFKIAVAVQVALLAIMLIATPALAAELRGDDSVIIASGDVVDDDLYVGGNRIVVNGTINGDLVAAGDTITIDGVVNGDVIAFGANIDVSGTVTGTVRAAGGNINIAGTVGEDVVVAGGDIDLLDAARIGRDLVFGAGNINIDSFVGSDVIGAGGAVRLADGIDGNVEIAVDKLTIRSTANIKGDLVYTSENKANIATGAQIAGEIIRKTPKDTTWHYNWNLSFFNTWSKIISYLMALIVGIIIILAAPKKSAEVAGALRDRSLLSLGWGALIFFVAPVGVVILILTIIGIPLGLLAAILYGILIFLSQLVIGLFAGRWVVERLNIEPSRGTLIIALLIGFTVLTLLKLIPFVGFILWWATVLFGIGAIAISFRRKKENGLPVTTTEQYQI